MITRTQHGWTATALAAGLALVAGSAGAQRFTPAFPIQTYETPLGHDSALADVTAHSDQTLADATAGPAPAASFRPETPAYSAGQTIGDIVSQPVRDIGVKQTPIPPVLASAEVSPYAMSDASNCAQMAQALGELDEVLGPDYTVERLTPENKKGKLAEAGGRAVVNSIIPFRGIVREVTGAAAADRRMAAAIDAGLARRGFLRGLQTAQGCEPGAQASLGR